MATCRRVSGARRHRGGLQDDGVAAGGQPDRHVLIEDPTWSLQKKKNKTSDLKLKTFRSAAPVLNLDLSRGNLLQRLLLHLQTHTNTPTTGFTFSSTLHTHWHHRMRKMMTTSRRMMVTRQPIRTGVFPSSEESEADGGAAGGSERRTQVN